jgi:hypothetical protein
MEGIESEGKPSFVVNEKQIEIVFNDLMDVFEVITNQAEVEVDPVVKVWLMTLTHAVSTCLSAIYIDQTGAKITREQMLEGTDITMVQERMLQRRP